VNGCDAVVSHEVFHTLCPVCLGSDDHCEACNGMAIKVWHRCPASMTFRPHYGLLDSYAAWADHNVMPVDGGWMAQAAQWTRLIKVSNVERARIEEERRPRGKKPAE
jgi:hypothetical protein